MAEVSFLCKQTVVSTKPVQPGKFYPLSVLDRVMERNHLRVVYYYRTPMRREAGELTRKLMESLSELLSCFPMVIGRLEQSEEGHWRIKCNDAGVRMVDARARGSVEEWLRSVDREKELKLVHWEDMFHKPYFWSTFYLQLTEFEEGGLAIGLSCTHLLSDPICATMFIKAWADKTLGGNMVTPPLFHPLPPRRPGNRNINHQPYTHLITYYKSYFDKPAPTINVPRSTVTLTFTSEMVQACMAMARNPRAPDGSTPSPFEALAALFWICIGNVKGMKSGLTNMSICLDMRKVLGLDKGFFGNCMVYNKVHGEVLEGNQLSKASMAIREVVRKMDYDGVMDLIEWMERDDHLSPPLMNGCDLICANLEGVDSYSAMFEDGFSPIRASYYIEPEIGEGQVLILPSSPLEGPYSRVVMVTLSKDEVVKLCENALILHFSPNISMGLNKNCT
ncbi:protein ECERIFERUM 26-like [Cornus florida]|uniref:protein ECERIFERUM 26-like n=1 Tax=Cornus florida TaxID=4283 RepID=UPI0028A29D46|nr:protein ECERIFERUM 26-like [Cornus florida]